MSLLCCCTQVNTLSSPVNIVTQRLSGMDTEIAEYLPVSTITVAFGYE